MSEEREKLNLTKEQAGDLINGDLEGFKVISDKIVGHRRWSVDHYVIVERESDGKFFGGHYSVGATESQWERPFEYDEPKFNQVFKKEKTIVVYE